MLPSRLMRAFPRRAAQRYTRPLHPHTRLGPLFSPIHQVRYSSARPGTLRAFWDKHGAFRYAIIRDMYRTNPFSMATWSIIMVTLFTILFHANYKYMVTLPEYLRYPEEVSKPLRKALFYTNVDFKPKLALKWYEETLRVTYELRLDAFTEELVGLRLQIVAFLEKIGDYPGAVRLLETMMGDYRKWLDERGHWPGREAQRTMLLRKCVQISVKLAELYSCDYMLENEKAEEVLVWGVETALKEQKRRQEEGVKEGEGDWISPEELGGTMEALAHVYEGKNRYFLAAPLFLQAISLADPKSCHMTVLMNNLSICLAQQDPPPMPGQAPTSRSALVANARAWSQKAIEIATSIKPPERDEECDVGCAVATHNLGEFAEMDGNIVEARKRYEEARSIAKAIEFKEGVENSERAIKRISQTRTAGDP